MYSNKKQEFIEYLLEWYGRNGRHDLPWRQPETSSFQLLISQFLLQSTQADQVVGVYKQTIRKYPCADDVYESESSLEDLQGKIAPIGLPKRAEYITSSAETIVDKYEGKVPETPTELKSFYGVGNYTAYAVLAHAFNQNIAAVDTNVARILARVFDLDSTNEPYSDEIWNLAQYLVPEGKASEYNYALVDFGAKVCTVSDPKCDGCPLNHLCEYYLRSTSQVSGTQLNK